MLRLAHRWTGGIVGLLLAVIGLSGALMVWEHTWLCLPRSNERLVTDSKTLGASVEAALTEEPGLKRITFASEEIGLHEAIYSNGSGAYFAQDGVLVDRWTSIWDRPELWLFELHQHLLLGQNGKYITGLLGLVLFAFSASGIGLWWQTRKTFELRLWPARMTRSGIIRQHRDLGIVAAPLLMLSGITGTLILFPVAYEILSSPWAGPEIGNSTPPKGLPLTGSKTDWQKAIANARSAFPGAVLRRITFPEPGAAITVRLKQPFEWTPNGRSLVWLDPSNGALLASKEPPSNGSAVIAEALYPIHSGKIGGTVWKLFLTFGGLGLAMLGTLGCWSFWFRNAHN
ncbi:PepSY-associated TM helix domain-containing protein [Croceibacterium salegens]|uniref:PepSY-associated TM helix domain-containing protein n=1 Tax=Croceibacterium salegens TaxID=1737568 RepID=UPI001F27AB4C|nr:PepSY-associated TM helix domain-containing protein [Croceibacterium salegens]